MDTVYGCDGRNSDGGESRTRRVDDDLGYHRLGVCLGKPLWCRHHRQRIACRRANSYALTVAGNLQFSNYINMNNGYGVLYGGSDKSGNFNFNAAYGREGQLDLFTLVSGWYGEHAGERDQRRANFLFGHDRCGPGGGLEQWKPDREV